MRLLRSAGWLSVAVAVFFLGLVARGYVEAHSTPLVRRAEVALPGWPKGRPAVTVALLSDLHVGALSRTPDELRRVAAQVDALRPDLILIAGDFLAGSKLRTAQEDERLLGALSDLHAPLGVVAVLGNHDYWGGDDRLEQVLVRHGVTLLRNAAVQRGPLAIGGVDDPVTGHDQIDAVARALRALPGPRLVLAHSPEILEVLPPDMPLLLAGHTHCGQIRLPIIAPNGPPWPYAVPECGMAHDSGRTVIISAGIGTSVVPIRLGAPPDLWLITLGPPRAVDRATAR